MIVCCPEGFYRKGNVDIVCAKYNVPVFENFDEFKGAVRLRMIEMGGMGIRKIAAGKIFWHGSDNEIEQFKIADEKFALSGKGVYLYRNRNSAKAYGNILYRVDVPSRFKIAPIGYQIPDDTVEGLFTHLGITSEWAKGNLPSGTRSVVWWCTDGWNYYHVDRAKTANLVSLMMKNNGWDGMLADYPNGGEVCVVWKRYEDLMPKKLEPKKPEIAASDRMAWRIMAREFVMRMHTEKTADETDPMANEKLSSLFLSLHTWATRKATSLPPGAPVASQILDGLNAVETALRGKMGLRGREAVVELMKAAKGYFNLDSPPFPSLIRKYGVEAIREAAGRFFSSTAGMGDTHPFGSPLRRRRDYGSDGESEGRKLPSEDICTGSEGNMRVRVIAERIASKAKEFLGE